MCVRACVRACEHKEWLATLDLKTREKEIVLASFNQPSSRYTHTHGGDDDAKERISFFLSFTVSVLALS